MYPIFVSPVSPTVKFKSASLYHQPFLSNRPFLVQVSRMTIKNDFEQYKVKCNHILVVTLSPSSQFPPVSLYNQPFPFQGAGHFVTSAPNDPPNGIEHHKVKGTPCMHY